MASATPSTPKSKSKMLPPDTQPVQRFSSQGDYRTGDLFLGRQAVLKDLGRYLQVPYATIIRFAFGSPPDTSQIRQKLIEEGILNVLPDGKTSQWARFTATPAQSGASGSINVPESVAFHPLAEIISAIFIQIPSCQVSFAANSSATLLSERRNTSRPDAHIVYLAKSKIHWFDIAIPVELKKTKDRSAKHDNEQRMIWDLHHIMREDPLRRFALGITIEETDMRLWYSNRAFLAVSAPIDFATDINDVISLFYLIGIQSVNKEKLGWDPTVKDVLVGQDIQYYKFEIGNQNFITTRPLATYGADAIVGRGTRVYDLEWITINVDPTLSEKRHLPGTEHILDSVRPPTELARRRVRPPSVEIPCRVHNRTVFEELGTTLMNVTCLADAFICLSGALQALYYLHKAGWVHRDFSVANVLWVEKDGQWIGKLTDFEKISSEVSHDVQTGTMHFMALEVERQLYIFLPRPKFESALSNQPSTDEAPFRMNFLHDLESLWWAAIWVLFYYTDAKSPTEDPDGQLMYFDQAFPCAIGQSSRRDFFTVIAILYRAYKTLSMTYRRECTLVINLADILRECYEEAEKSYPLLSLNDNLLEDIHKKVSDALEQLKESNINLQSLRELQGRKRNIDDSPTHRPEKKAKRA